MKARPNIILPEVKNMLKSLGKKIREHRKFMKISTTQVLTDTGISRSTLTRIESGSPKVAIAAYFQVMFCIYMYRDLSSMTGK